MKIKLDENLPHRLATLLKNLSHEVDTVNDENLTGSADSEVWQVAQKESRIFITQDLDFSDARKYLPGSHHGLVLIRLHSPNRRNLIDRVVELFQNENVSEWPGCFVVATERKIRILKPKTSKDS
jgi:predicted nuclease of predicted toxin-antitoxin system